nr:23S rRNA (pseudouridine(1915)-N(3))-methyltransferase RlmH [Clostridium sp.]
MNFKIYITGDKLEKFFVEAIKEYEKRLSRYCKIELLYFKNKEQLSKKLLDKSYKILLSVKGENISSVGLASKISSLGLSGISDIAIIIGTDLPHDEALALSPMEMDLGLQTTIIFEQIYRSYRIINNEAYHK